MLWFGLNLSWFKLVIGCQAYHRLLGKILDGWARFAVAWQDFRLCGIKSNQNIF